MSSPATSEYEPSPHISPSSPSSSIHSTLSSTSGNILVSQSKSTLQLPPHSLTALVHPSTPSMTGTPLTSVLTNPFYPSALSSIEQTLASDASLLRTYINHLEPDPEAAESLHTYALSDPTTRNLVISRYTEAKVKFDIQERIIDGIDFPSMQKEVSELLTQASDDVSSGQRLIPVLSTYIEVYSYLSPRFIAPYAVRQSALESMLSLGEGIMGLEGKTEVQKGLMEGGVVLGKLGLAIKKNLGDLGANNRDAWRREIGYMRKAGLVERVKGVVVGLSLHGDWDELLGS